VNARRHDRLADFGDTAFRTGDLAALCLPIESCAVAEPGLELVAFLALQSVADHAPAPTLALTASCTSSKGRSCSREGTRERAVATAASSTSALMTPGVAPSASTRISPHGDTIMLWPNVLRPFSCVPACAAASTKHWVSIARARSSVCQCAWPVGTVNAA